MEFWNKDYNFQTQIGWSAMNHGDAFILDTGVVLFVWVGKEASRTERIKVRNCQRFPQEKYHLEYK